MYTSDAYVLFGDRTSYNDGGLIDINLKYNRTQKFSVGSTKTHTYSFWFTQKSNSLQKAYLYARGSEVLGDYFVENKGSPQLIYIQDKRVYFSFTSAAGTVLSGYSDQLIEVGSLYNVVVAVNTNLATGQKVNIYVNGRNVSVNIISILAPPSNFQSLNIVSALKTTGNTGNTSNIGYSSQTTQLYRISSYDQNGESKASQLILAPTNSLRTSVKLSWDKVSGASGYYIYRSLSSSFGPYSLIADINSGNTVTFTDGNLQTKQGAPFDSPNYLYNYDPDVTTLVDDENAKVCFGNYPITTKTLNYFQGYIYRVAIYDTKLVDSQINQNYYSFLYKYSSQNPDSVYNMKLSRSVINRKVRHGTN